MDPFPGLADEYAPLRLRGEVWGALSVLFAVAALFARSLLRLVVPALMTWPRSLWLSSVAPPVLAAGGLLFGLLGRWLSGRGLLVRVGVWTNLGILILSLLFLTAFFLILPPEWRGFPPPRGR